MTEFEGAQRRIARGWLLTLAIVFTAGGLLYRMLVSHQPLGGSSLMFMGVPVVLSVLLVLAPPAKTATGGILFGITLVLVVLAPIMGEGYLCILFASPLFYGFGVAVGKGIESIRRMEDQRRKNSARCAAAVLLIPMCLEGVFPATTIPRGQTVEVTRVVAAPSSAVEQALAAPTRIGQPLPRFLRIGFPRPLAVHGGGLTEGDTRTIHFSGAEGDPEGDLVTRVVAREPGFVRFETVSDGSKLTQWVRWEASDVQWRALDATHTRVTWRIHFARQLDPAWYFTPWERLAVRQAAGYLITANATPAGAQQ